MDLHYFSRVALGPRHSKSPASLHGTLNRRRLLCGLMAKVERKTYSPKFGRFLSDLKHLVPWRTYKSLTLGYAAFVTWPSDCHHVKAQDSYLPSL